MRTSSLLSVSFVAGAVALLGLGCNPMASIENKVSQKVGEKVAEGILNTASGGKVNVDAKDGEYSFTDNKTGAMMAVGTDVAIPDKFPKDVLIYPGAKALSVSMSGTEQDRGDSVTLQSKDDVATATKWYEERFKAEGWTEVSSMTANGTELRTYAKGDIKISFTVLNANEEEKGSIITLTRVTDKE